MPEATLRIQGHNLQSGNLLDNLSGNLSAELKAIFNCASASDPVERYRSADSFLKNSKAWLHSCLSSLVRYHC